MRIPTGRLWIGERNVLHTWRSLLQGGTAAELEPFSRLDLALS